MPDLIHPLPGILDVPSLNLLAGASGIGKTALLASMSTVFRDGGTLFGHQVQPAPGVGYIGADRGINSARTWFVAAGFPDIPTYGVIDDRGFDLDQFYGQRSGPALFAHCVTQLALPPGSLILVDPVALFLGSNLLDYRAVAVAAAKIQRWLLDHPYCVIGICHTSKQRADPKDRYMRPQDRILGTGALLGYTSTQMYLMGPEESGRDTGHTFIWNPHHRPEETFVLPKGDNGLFPLAPAAVPKPALTSDQQTLLDLFPAPDQAMNTGQLVTLLRDTGSEVAAIRRTLTRRLRELEALGYVWQVKHGLWARTRLAGA